MYECRCWNSVKLDMVIVCSGFLRYWLAKKKYNTKIVLFAPCCIKNRLRLFLNVFWLYLKDNTTPINIIVIACVSWYFLVIGKFFLFITKYLANI